MKTTTIKFDFRIKLEACGANLVDIDLRTSGVTFGLGHQMPSCVEFLVDRAGPILYVH